MSADVESRLIDLETRLAFQEQALAELSDALAESRIETTRLARMLQNALDELHASRGVLYSDPQSEPPPPHY